MSGSFKVGLQFTADAKAAKAEVDALAATVRKAGAEVDGLSTKGTKAKVATEGLGQAAVRADAEFAGLKTEIASLKSTIDAMTAAEDRAAIKTKALSQKLADLEAKMGRGGRAGGTGAAGATGNLVAQFNDLGVMMAAGQNPLQLAIQQGTQITQVIGPMGTGGAVKALGSAFLGMLNPLNLFVIGAIAGGAALVQWAVGALRAGSDTTDFDEKIQLLTSSISEYKKFVELAATSTEDLESRFGTAGAEAHRIATSMAMFARVDAVRELDAAVASLTEQFGGLSRTQLVYNNGAMSQLDDTFFNLREELKLTDEQAATVLRSLEALANAGTMDAKIAAADQLNQSFIRVFGSVEQIPIPLLDAAKNAGLLALQAADIAAAIGPATAALRDQVAAQQEITRATAERQVAAAAARLEDEVTAQSMLAATAEQSNMQALIAQYGAESARVADAQAAAARAVYEATVDALDVTEARKKELMISYDVERMMASLNIAGPIDAAAGSAATLAGNMSAALSFAQQIAMVQAATPEAPAALGFGLGAAPNGGTGTTLGFGNNRGSTFNAPPTNFGGAGAGAGGGGGGGAVREERDAVAELIERLQAEADIRAELDPVQQQMLRYREDMAGATAEQRAEVEALIAAEQREADAAQATQDRWQYLRQTAYDALLIMAKGGDDASDALRNLGASLAEAAFQAAIMGEGPLGSLFGGTSIFGLIGGALGLGGGAAGGIRGHARGGMITGPGDGTSDSILMYGSSGEMMMNARAVRKNRHVLEAMNANSPVGYAKGGLIGAGRVTSGAGSASGGQPVAVSLKIDVTGARGNAEIMSMVRAGVEQGMAHYDRMILPTSVRRVSADSRRIG